MSNVNNNKRIAKNTILLYVRMIFLMGVTLYTSRVILQVLGVVDFGIYNVVGGVVTMLGFVSSSLSGATSRFITFELGLGSSGNVKRVFQCAVTVHYLMAIFVLFLAESIGLWFVTSKLVIPLGRETAVLWVYQCSVITFIVSILSVPYNALIIAHERMNAFAYISVFEVLARLFIVLLLQFSNYDRLVIYGVLILLVQLFIRLLYTIYCNRNFKESSAKPLWDKAISKKLAVYAGWTLNGGIAVIGYTQGINVLLNLFFGPVVNASRAIAVQVQGAMTQLFANFQMAVRPQITKSYAQGDYNYMHSLVLNSSRYSFFLILIIALPVLVNTDYILYIWLGNVPKHAVNFTRLMVLSCINEAFKGPTIIAIHATGNIKKFQMIEASLLLTIIPLSYVLLRYVHISAEMVFVVYLVIESITQIIRVYIVYPYVGMPISLYFLKVLLPVFKVSLPLSVVGFLFYDYYLAVDFYSLIINSLFCIIISVAIIGTFGITQNEKEWVIKKFKCSIFKNRY